MNFVTKKIVSQVKRVPILFIFLFVYSCTSTQQNVSESKNAHAVVPDNPHDDAEYAPELLKWERDVTLYKDYVMYFSGTATLMAPDMVDAYKKRFEKVQGEAKFDVNIVPPDKDTLSVIVTVYNAFSKFSELDDNKIWNCALSYNNKWISPSSLVYYRNKSSFTPYFTTGSPWSRMYVIQFKVAHLESNQNPIEFSMHSGIAQADYYWK